MDNAGGTTLLLKTVLMGTEDVLAGADAAKKLSEEEEKALAAVNKMPGPYQNAARYARELAAAQKAGVGGNAAKDAEYRASQAQKRVERIENQNQPENRGEAFAKALMSSRFGAGGLNPLVGQSARALAGQAGADALSGAAKLAGNALEPLIGGAEAAATALGPVGIVAGAAALGMVKLVKGAEEMAVEASRVTQVFSDLRAQTGGNSADTAKLAGISRITGVDGAAGAKGFQDRITTDPFAMATGAGLGIRNVAGPYGNLNYAQQYTKAIERTAAIQDEGMRRRAAMALGIEQEVSRYSKLSPETRGRIARIADTNARINNPEAERQAAELQAASANAEAAGENVKTAFGHLFGGGTTKFLNWLADTENRLADNINTLADGADKVSQFFGGGKGKSGTGLDSKTQAGMKQSGYEFGANDPTTAQNANTMAMKENTAELAKVRQIWGGGERANSALPSRLNGANLSQAIAARGLRIGALG